MKQDSSTTTFPSVASSVNTMVYSWSGEGGTQQQDQQRQQVKNPFF